MSINLKDDILKAVKEAKELDAVIHTQPKTPEFIKFTPPPTVKTTCTYKTPCGWCTKWDKKCDCKPYKRGLRVKINPIDDAIGILDDTNQICVSEEDH